ncbi:hypothetical protein DQW50_16260 [Halorubrum sp. 48-1-W]|uniref:hypothetical protein n=1 Tax=Halorubrum sp. 48-1-W TaxID=2249761 RepID=UPI000DCB33D0|nr:hypothetical protein [Halorubrum sp. 48-1-W]RAW44076.1 hypothetical protein DQW50_16260 [Halorubrum sp. 48-1-W]
MSADRPDTFIDDRPRLRIPDDAPLREIAPDDFVARSPASTLREALRIAERQTSRDVDQLPRCPDCLSTQIRSKPGALEMTHKRDEQFKCTNCGEHFDEPAPSREEERDGEQATLTDVRRKAVTSQSASGDDGTDAVGVSVPQTPTVSVDECARWRRELRGARSMAEGIDDKRSQQTLKFHVRGECACDSDEPALTYERRGAVGEWVVRDD